LGFFSSLFGGQNETLDQQIPKLGAVGDWATGQGESDINAGSSFWKSILSGNTADQMKVLGPAVNSAKTSASQDMKTNSMFGGRSGGTAASNAATQDKVHGYIANLIGSLTGGAASSLASTGGGLLSTGLKSYGQQEQASQEQMTNWQNSILGGAITGAAGIGLDWASGGAATGTGMINNWLGSLGKKSDGGGDE
jgi:hypothetical protein